MVGWSNKILLERESEGGNDGRTTGKHGGVLLRMLKPVTPDEKKMFLRAGCYKRSPF